MLRGGPVRWNLDPMSARVWKEKGVGTFPIYFSYQIQLTEGLSFVPTDPTWAPSVRLSCWRPRMNRLLLLCSLPLVWTLGLSLQQYVDCRACRPFQNPEHRCFRSLQRPQAGPLRLSPLRPHPATAASMFWKQCRHWLWVPPSGLFQSRVVKEKLKRSGKWPEWPTKV